MKRPGYYVEGRYYADRFHQAVARAEWCATEWMRPVDVWRVDAHNERPLHVLAARPRPSKYAA